MDVITKQKSKLPQIADVFLVMIHSGNRDRAASFRVGGLKKNA